MYRSCLVAGAIALVSGIAAPSSAMAESSNWIRYGLDSNETRHSPLSQINTANVAQLGLAWVAELKDRHRRDELPNPEIFAHPCVY